MKIATVRLIAMATLIFWLTVGAILTSQSAGAMTISSDGGGSVRNYHLKAMDADRSGEAVEITGMCVSACTLYLIARGTCVHPGARLGFHGPYRFFSKLTDQESMAWGTFIAAHYPKKLRDWYNAGPRHGRRVVWLSSSELVYMGVRAC